MSSPEAPRILVVEDDPATARIVSTVLAKLDSDISTDVVPDGRDCLAVLRGEHETIPEPDIVLLDLNLVEVDGLTVLENRAEDELMGQAPIIVVSGENDSETVVQCYDTGANTYFSKPDDLSGYRDVLESIVDHWVGKAELPSQHVVTRQAET